MAAHSSGGMESSNPRRWRVWQLHYHGDGVCKVICDFHVVWFLTHDSSVGLVSPTF
jgi:hypothetical protein